MPFNNSSVIWWCTCWSVFMDRVILFWVFVTVLILFVDSSLRSASCRSWHSWHLILWCTGMILLRLKFQMHTITVFGTLHGILLDIFFAGIATFFANVQCLLPFSFTRDIFMASSFVYFRIIVFICKCFSYDYGENVI